MCACSLNYTALNEHAPCYTVICGLSGSTNISTLSYKRQNFRKKKLTEYKMCVLIFSTTFVWNIYHSKY
jgi:hypothetical protein